MTKPRSTSMANERDETEACTAPTAAANGGVELGAGEGSCLEGAVVFKAGRTDGVVGRGFF